uniref:AP-5 complex subunit zeta-1 N-terminal TPR domain-containing protein n=1 Tax=Xiphophorus couchianus TaxID=32473 RepID=A0A3B5MVW0_9TELE
MYSLGSESLIKQAREIQETELQKFYSRLVKLLQLKELGHETVDSLQRLHLILSANKYARTICYNNFDSSFTVWRAGRLTGRLARSCSPCRCSTASSGSAERASPKVTSGRKEAPQYSVFTVTCDSYPSFSPPEHVTILNKKFVDWLRYASILQGGGASLGGFFTGPRSRQPLPTAELDGSVSGDFFTVLCVGQGFTEDQWMNVYSFSMLRHWLLTYHSVSSGNSTMDAVYHIKILLQSIELYAWKGTKWEKVQRLGILLQGTLYVRLMFYCSAFQTLTNRRMLTKWDFVLYKRASSTHESQRLLNLHIAHMKQPAFFCFVLIISSKQAAAQPLPLPLLFQW